MNKKIKAMLKAYEQSGVKDEKMEIIKLLYEENELLKTAVSLEDWA